MTNIFLVAVNASVQSQVIQFSTTYDTIAPSTPVLDDDYFFVEGDIYEFGPEGDSTGPVRGLVTSSDLAKIYVYTDSALTQLHNFSVVDSTNFAWEVIITLQLGSNDFYIVAEDFAGNRSASIKRTFISEIVSQ